MDSISNQFQITILTKRLDCFLSISCSFSTFASSALNEQSDAGLPVDCGVLVLVDFAYLFLVLGQAALAQVESVAVGIYKYKILLFIIKEFLERNPLALAHLAVAHWADCFS